jgi:hypothetical protein
MTPAQISFTRVVKQYYPRLKAATGLAGDDQAALWGNLGHESIGMTTLQEKGIKMKTLREGPGGWSWPQWTGPRRRQFFDFCKAKDLDFHSDEAAFQFLVKELKETELKAIPMTRKAIGLRAKVIAFEMGFERAGKKHYESREEWAIVAQQIICDIEKTVPLPDAPPIEPKPAPTPAPGKVDRPGSFIAKVIIWLIGTAAAAAAAWLGWGS